MGRFGYLIQLETTPQKEERKYQKYSGLWNNFEISHDVFHPPHGLSL